MRLFQRRTARAFWRDGAPVSDPDVLYQMGIRYVMREDGPEMMKLGWALWEMSPPHRRDALNLLTDGYKVWLENSKPDAAVEFAYLGDMFDSLTDDERDREHSPSPELSQARIWSGTQLIVRATALGDDATRGQYAPRVLALLRAAAPDLLPARSVELLQHLARDYDAQEPFPPS